MIKLLLFITQLHHELINYLLTIHLKYNCYNFTSLDQLAKQLSPELSIHMDFEFVVTVLLLVEFAQ